MTDGSLYVVMTDAVIHNDNQGCLRRSPSTPATPTASVRSSPSTTPIIFPQQR